MTQARIDLHSQGIFEGNPDYNWGDIGTTYVVDAMNGVGGLVDWKDEESFFRRTFHPRIINTKRPVKVLSQFQDTRSTGRRCVCDLHTVIHSFFDDQYA